jgi:hypothetical protein
MEFQPFRPVAEREGRRHLCLGRGLMSGRSRPAGWVAGRRRVGAGGGLCFRLDPVVVRPVVETIVGNQAELAGPGSPSPLSLGSGIPFGGLGGSGLRLHGGLDH